MSSKLRKFKYTLTGLLSDCGKYLILDTPAIVQKLMSHLQDKHLEIYIKEVEYNRTEQQNRYYWGVVVASFIGHYWHTQGEKIKADEVNEYFMRIYNGGKESKRSILGVEVNSYAFKGTSEMSVKDFSNFIEVIKKHCEENCDLIIPEATGHSFISDYVK